MLIKTIVTTMMIGFLVVPAFSQGRRQVSTTLPWHVNAEEAFVEAAEEDLPILAVFR